MEFLQSISFDDTSPVTPTSSGTNSVTVRDAVIIPSGTRVTAVVNAILSGSDETADGSITITPAGQSAIVVPFNASTIDFSADPDNAARVERVKSVVLVAYNNIREHFNQ